MPRPAQYWLTAIALCIALLTGPIAAGAPDFGLQEQSAPEDTEEFTEAYGECSAALVNFPLANAASEESPELTLKYRPTPLFTETSATALIAYITTPSFMVRGDTVYRLVTLQLHLPGPELSEQGSYPLLAHFVHYGQDGSFGVLGVRFVEGEASPELEKLINAAVDSVTAPGLNPRDLVPERIDIPYQLGPGELPGCDYRLYWYLVAQPMQASPAQIEALQQLLAPPSN